MPKMNRLLDPFFTYSITQQYNEALNKEKQLKEYFEHEFGALYKKDSFWNWLDTKKVEHYISRILNLSMLPDFEIYKSAYMNNEIFEGVITLKFKTICIEIPFPINVTAINAAEVQPIKATYPAQELLKDIKQDVIIDYDNYLEQVKNVQIMFFENRNNPIMAIARNPIFNKYPIINGSHRIIGKSRNDMNSIIEVNVYTDLDLGKYSIGPGYDEIYHIFLDMRKDLKSAL